MTDAEHLAELAAALEVVAAAESEAWNRLWLRLVKESPAVRAARLPSKPKTERSRT